MPESNLAPSLSSIPSSAGGIARLACDRLRDAGIDPTPVMAGAGLTAEEVQDRKRRLDTRAQVRVLELASKELRDDCFGFHLARGFELGEIGLVYYVMASSGRLVDAVRNAERYCAINNEGVRLRVSLEHAFTIGLEYLSIDRLSDRDHMEFWVVALVRICRTLTSSRLAPKQIKLKHFRSETPSDIRSFLGCDIDFAADRDEILFPEPIGELPVVGADVHLNKLLLQYADEALSNRASRRASTRSHVEDRAIASAWQSQHVRDRPPPRHESPNACACTVRRGRRFLGRAWDVAAGACQALSPGNGTSDFQDRVAFGV
jgi:Arabinose-binding domain of AraC transcription regulator, N-term